jgi:hypothetical protein
VGILAERSIVPVSIQADENNNDNNTLGDQSDG